MGIISAYFIFDLYSTCSMLWCNIKRMNTTSAIVYFCHSARINVCAVHGFWLTEHIPCTYLWQLWNKSTALKTHTQVPVLIARDLGQFYSTSGYLPFVLLMFVYCHCQTVSLFSNISPLSCRHATWRAVTLCLDSFPINADHRTKLLSDW